MTHVGQRCNFRLVYDTSYPEVDHSVFKKYYWSEFYRDVKEAIPLNALEPCDKYIEICLFVDSDHARDKVSCTSRSDFMV